MTEILHKTARDFIICVSVNQICFYARLDCALQGLYGPVAATRREGLHLYHYRLYAELYQFSEKI